MHLSSNIDLLVYPKPLLREVVSILNIITISCLFALYIISPLNSFIIYPYKLFLLIELSANNISLVQINNCILLLLSLLLSCPLLLIFLPLLFPSISPLQQITLLLILYRYLSIRRISTDSSRNVRYALQYVEINRPQETYLQELLYW